MLSTPPSYAGGTALDGPGPDLEHSGAAISDCRLMACPILGTLSYNTKKKKSGMTVRSSLWGQTLSVSLDSKETRPCSADGASWGCACRWACQVVNTSNRNHRPGNLEYATDSSALLTRIGKDLKEIQGNSWRIGR